MSEPVTEETLFFSCGDDRLLGVISRPPKNTVGRETGVVVVVGGPQYRAGSHRQFVQMARHLASRGVTCLRFDVRGMGDSEGELRSFEDLDDDIACAVRTLRTAEPALKRVVLWGLCDGASAALLYLQRQADPDVAGLVLLNPWVRSAQTLARTHVKHYYRQRLLQKSFWLKLLTGGVGGGALKGLAGSVRSARGDSASTEHGFQHRMALGWQCFAGPILLIISEADLTGREFEDAAAREPAWQAAMRKRPPHRVLLPGADHTCAVPGSKAQAEQAVIAWLERAFP